MKAVLSAATAFAGAALASAQGSADPYNIAFHKSFGQTLSQAHPGITPIPAPDPEQAAEIGSDGSVRRLANGGINLVGLNLPVDFTWDDNGWVYIAEKAGRIKAIQGWQGTPTNVILDITAQVFSYGDHGLIGLNYNNGFLYGSYMLINPKIGEDCTDYGQMDGRPLDEVVGCMTWGRFSRWPVANGQITGPEQLLIDGTAESADGGPADCVQFSTHGAFGVTTGPDGAIYVSFGDGAAFTLVDVGQLGQDPCNSPAGYKGAFRSQDPQRLNGKVFRLDPNTLQFAMWTTGHRNPFRLTIINNQLMESETGWYTAEEINVLTQGSNYGWPCYEGPAMAPDYSNFFAGNPACEYLQNNNAATWPAYYYLHPPKLHPGNIASISALGEFNNRIYFGDYTMGWIKSIDMNFQGETLEVQGVYPIKLQNTPAGFAYIDFTYMTISTVPLGAELASPSPSATAAYARIIAGNSATQSGQWTAGSGGKLSFNGLSNVAGREGAIYTWVIREFTDCGVQNCGQVVLFNQSGTVNVSIPIPATKGTVMAQLSVGTYAAHATEAAPFFTVSKGASMCTCGYEMEESTSITKSPAFLGGVGAAAALVSLGIVGAALWVAGVPQKLMGRDPNASAARKRPGVGAGTCGTTGDASAPAAASGSDAAVAGAGAAAAAGASKADSNGKAEAVSTNGTGAAAAASGKKAKSSIADRRPGAPSVPTLHTGASKSSGAVTIPAAAAAGANVPSVPITPAVGEATPTGNKRV